MEIPLNPSLTKGEAVIVLLQPGCEGGFSIYAGETCLLAALDKEEQAGIIQSGLLFRNLVSYSQVDTFNRFLVTFCVRAAGKCRNWQTGQT
jgi:hypothetical protein